MNLDTFITKYTGQRVLYPGQNLSLAGQCVQLVMLYMKLVQGVEPPVYPSAKNYWNNISGYSAVTTPQAGDIAVYNGHGIYTDGHIAICVDPTQVFEQNADPDGSPAHIFARANTYLLGYLRKDEVMETWNNGDTYNLLNQTVSTVVANQAQAANYVGFFGLQDGRDFKQAFYEIITSLQYGQLVQAAHSSGVTHDTALAYVQANLK